MLPGAGHCEWTTWGGEKEANRWYHGDIRTRRVGKWFGQDAWRTSEGRGPQVGDCGREICRGPIVDDKQGPREEREGRAPGEAVAPTCRACYVERVGGTGVG